MSSTDGHSVKMQFHLQEHNYHHAISANLPTFVNRSVPSYSVPNQVSNVRGKSSSPRYSPNIQPWKRQQAPSSLSFVPSPSPRIEQPEYTTAQPRASSERPPVYMSPFRSVRKMKQPFELRLPSSPSTESLAASGKESPLSRKPSKTRTLRPWRSDQNLRVTSIDSFGLLPSPPLSDTRSPHDSPSFYFSPKPESESDYSQKSPNGCGCVAGRESCRDCYTSPQSEPRQAPKDVKGTPHVRMAHSHLARQCETSDGQLTPASTYSERMSSPAPYSDYEPIGKRNFSNSSIGAGRSRSGTVSSDGSWAPSSLSYWEPWLQRAPVEGAEGQGERLKELNRRRIQIVQKSPPPPPRKVELKAARPMYAVATKTKPKLVDISRQSSPAMSYTLPTPQHPVPSTPDQGQQEISAFSPDTPLEMSDSGYITHHSCYSPNDYAHAKAPAEEDEDDDEEDEDDDDVYTDISSVASETIGETMIETKSAPSPELPKSPPKPEVPPKFAASVQVSPGRSSTSTKSEKEELEKWWDHEWTIDQLELSVKDFPRNMLRLTSPVIMFLRHNNERALLRPFRTIFPSVAENLLDGLCAALIARNYVVSLATAHQRKSQLNQRSRLDTVPEKATAVSGTSSHTTPSRQVLETRSMQLRRDLDRIVEKMLFAICGQAEEHLKSAVLVLAQVLETKN